MEVGGAVDDCCGWDRGCFFKWGCGGRGGARRCRWCYVVAAVSFVDDDDDDDDGYDDCDITAMVGHMVAVVATSMVGFGVLLFP